MIVTLLESRVLQYRLVGAAEEAGVEFLGVYASSQVSYCKTGKRLRLANGMWKYNSVCLHCTAAINEGMQETAAQIICCDKAKAGG